MLFIDVLIRAVAECGPKITRNLLNIIRDKEKTVKE